MVEQVDLIVIGSGQGGVPLATTLAAEGRRVVLFERERFGGSCINWGCTPSKAFLAAAHAAGRARAAAALGVHCRVEIDFGEVMGRVRRIRDQFERATRQRLEQAGVRIVRGEGRFAPNGAVTDGEHTFHAPTVVIDTGSTAALPSLPGLDRVQPLTDRTFWSLKTCPRRTLIIGGGYVGLELGQGLARLGSEVHLIERGERVLGREAPEVSAVLEAALSDDGVVLHHHARIAQVTGHGTLTELQLEDGRVLGGDAVVAAAGRRPNSAALNCAAVGIEVDARGYVVVSERLETTRPGVYAIGEVAGQPAFTHVSWEDHRRVLANLRGRRRTRADRVLGYALFTDPQVGRVGLSLAQATDRGLAVHEARLELRETNRAIEWGQESGFLQLVVEDRSGRIVGGTVVGHEAAELVQLLLDLIEAGATAEFLAGLQHIHPTYAEYFPVLARRALSNAVH